MDEEESRLIKDMEICEIKIWYVNKTIEFWEERRKMEREYYLQLLKRANGKFIGKYGNVPEKKEEEEVPK